jgi:hypothetical protein
MKDKIGEEVDTAMVTVDTAGKPIFCYECRSRNSFKVNPDYPLKDYQTEWVCKCGHKTWRPEAFKLNKEEK